MSFFKQLLLSSTVAVALAAAPAAAQTAPQPQTPQPGVAPPEPTIVEPADPAPPLVVVGEWIATGFVGGNFGERADEASVALGGALSYLHNGRFGGEFLAGFSPNFEFGPQVPGTSTVNNYMVNLIGAAPMGARGNFAPFVSGGVGAITVRADDVDDPIEFLTPDGTQFAGNIGAGIMAFAQHWGIRSDIRYFTAFGNGNDVGTQDVPGLDLADVRFWRGNLGISYRW